MHKPKLIYSFFMGRHHFRQKKPHWQRTARVYFQATLFSILSAFQHELLPSQPILCAVLAQDISAPSIDAAQPAELLQQLDLCSRYQHLQSLVPSFENSFLH